VGGITTEPVAETSSQSASPTARRLAVRVTKDAARQIRGGHPWVFDSSVVSVRPEGTAGDLAVIFDEQRDFMAIGLYDPDSPIRIRVLHHGKPRQVDGAFWRQQFAAAGERRGALVGSVHTDGYRWIHGENDGLPGLVVDRYGSTLVVKLYSPAWFPHLNDVVDALVEIAGPSNVVLRLGRTVARDAVPPWSERFTDGTALFGHLPTAPVRFKENDLNFAADVVHGQKTGHFLDQRDNRLRVRRLSRGARVLDVFCCTGGFTVNAAAGGAELVHSVDLSAPAIEATRQNMELNRHLPSVRDCHHHYTVGDAAEVMGQMAASGRRFDLVVVDPPSFAARKEQIPGALRAYGRLAESALALVEKGGTLVQSSCSARITAGDFVDAVELAAERSGVRLQDVTRTGHGIDHPVGFAQGEYLKAIFATVIPGR